MSRRGNTSSMIWTSRPLNVKKVAPAPTLAPRSPASSSTLVPAKVDAAARQLAGAHQVFDEMPGRRGANAGRVLRVTVRHMLYPVTEEALHRVFDAYGAEQVFGLETTDRAEVEALVRFRSRQDVARARDALNGRCIYDGCCLMDLQLDQPGVLHINVSHVLYPVTDDLLRQVLGEYGVKKLSLIRKNDHVEATVQLRSKSEAVRARDALHGRCIYDGCCFLHIHVVQPTPKTKTALDKPVPVPVPVSTLSQAALPAPVTVAAPAKVLTKVKEEEGQCIWSANAGEEGLMDKCYKLILRGMQFHGVKHEEKTLGQKFLIDVDAWMDLTVSGGTDNISDTVSCSDVYRIAKGIVEGTPHNLLESVAQSIANSTLLKFPQISAIRVKVGKPHVALQDVIDYLGVEIMRYRKA